MMDHRDHLEKIRDRRVRVEAVKQVSLQPELIYQGLVLLLEPKEGWKQRRRVTLQRGLS